MYEVDIKIYGFIFLESKVLPRKDKITKCNYNETTLFIYIITISQKTTLISSNRITNSNFIDTISLLFATFYNVNFA